MSQNFSSKEAHSEAAAFAIECRKIRLFLARNPGSTPFEIRKATNCSKPGTCLDKMLVMGLVRNEIIKEGGFTREAWFVVPQ